MLIRFGFFLYGCYGFNILHNIVSNNDYDSTIIRTYLDLCAGITILTSCIMGVFHNPYLPIEQAIGVGISGIIFQITCFFLFK